MDAEEEEKERIPAKIQILRDVFVNRRRSILVVQAAMNTLNAACLHDIQNVERIQLRIVKGTFQRLKRSVDEENNHRNMKFRQDLDWIDTHLRLLSNLEQHVENKGNLQTLKSMQESFESNFPSSKSSEFCEYPPEKLHGDVHDEVMKLQKTFSEQLQKNTKMFDFTEARTKTKASDFNCTGNSSILFCEALMI